MVSLIPFLASISLISAPAPANSNLLQSVAVMNGANGIGCSVGTLLPTTLPMAGSVGGKKVYQGVLMQTGAKARRPKQDGPMSGFQ